jgi:hypothetical protein
MSVCIRLGLGAAMVGLLSIAAGAQGPGPAPTGRISGQVLTSYGTLVPDAEVALFPIGRAGGSIDLAIRRGLTGSPRTARSGERGEFVFDQVPAGQYRLVATKSGFTSRVPAPASDPRELVHQFSLGPSVTVNDDGHVTADIVVHRTASISGRIIRPDGSAAPDVGVTVALRNAGGQAVLLLDGATASASDGRYEIADLPPGEYLVAAQPGLRAGGAMKLDAGTRDAAGVSTISRVSPEEAFRVTLYPGVPATEPGETVMLFEGIRAEGIDIWLTPAQRFNVSGRVFWPVGIAPGQITIDFGDPAGSRSGLWYVSDPGGLFTLMGIPPGPLTMLVRAESDQGPLLGLATTTVAVDSVEDVHIVVDRPGRVRGRVVYEFAVPQEQRAHAVRLVQKLVRVSAIYPAPEASPAPDGRFEIDGALGEYEIELPGLGAGLTISRVARGGVTLQGNRLGVAGGELVDDVEIVVGR